MRKTVPRTKMLLALDLVEAKRLYGTNLRPVVSLALRTDLLATARGSQHFAAAETGLCAPR